MVKVIIKGGVWKNTEDEILKAAIMKYGKNQWSRIASLLHRKSAKQCKARWQEWLDPRIKKTEWSREEDEKLLHLSKLMPTQWRTIAPLVGRTAAQCLERYEQLLNEAQRKVDGVDEDDEEEDAKDAKRLKAGEIDPAPESRPARPDPIDMDEDELEMLSEARARLANTKGKKAKRKARERQLSDARRLSTLQRRRELRAAGIDVGTSDYKQKKKHDYIDYNEAIPFERKVPLGFHDPSDDRYDKEEAILKAKFKEPVKDEATARKEDRKKLAKRKADEVPDTIFKKPNEIKRSKLVLPSPQISDNEVAEIVKIGRLNEGINEMRDGGAASELLTDYAESSRRAMSTRTMRTPATGADTIRKEAETILALQHTECPLKGGENTYLEDINLKTVLPQHQISATPNTLLKNFGATPSNNAGLSSVRSIVPPTPGAATPGFSVLRDGLSLNRESDLSFDIKSALKQLPKPKNDFQLEIPTDEDAEDEEVGDGIDTDAVEDEAEVDERRKKLIQLKQADLNKRRSVVYQRSLLIPSKVVSSAFKVKPTEEAILMAENLIKKEMEAMIRWDVTGQIPSNFDVTTTSDQMAIAGEMIKQESHEMLNYDQEMEWAMNLCHSELIQSNGKFTRISNLNRKDQMEALTAELNMLHKQIATLGKVVAKMDKKIQIKMKGYYVVAESNRKKLEEKRVQKEKYLQQTVAFKRLAAHEVESGKRRIGKLEEDINIVRTKEIEFQKTYDELSHRKWELENGK
uniref:Cell division cycle 5-like protein n=1 Tax=Rhabditophanes sp. KR3021 TaxID=114890 RepID=A0AC35UCW9_9BILA